MRGEELSKKDEMGMTSNASNGVLCNGVLGSQSYNAETSNHYLCNPLQGNVASFIGHYFSNQTSNMLTAETISKKELNPFRAQFPNQI